MSADETTWGVQPNGFVCPTQQDLIENLSNKLRQYVDPGIDLQPDSPDGQIIGVYTREAALAWEALRALNASMSRNGAEGDSLTNVGTLTGTKRQEATYTTVVAQCALAAGTTLVAGESLAAVENFPTKLFTPTNTFVAPSDGSHNVGFRCLETGPVTLAENTLKVIQTPVTGWTAINNSAAGVLGQNVATDTQYRQAQITDLYRTGSATAAALQSDIEALDGVIRCVVLENFTDFTDSNGVPPHSVEVLLYADETLDTAELAETVWLGRAATAQTSGNLFASYVDSTGATRTVRYSHFVELPIYLRYNIMTGDGYIGDTALKDAIVTEMTERTRVNTTVQYYYAASIPYRYTGVTAVPQFWMGIEPMPSGIEDIGMTSVRYYPTFSTARVQLL